MDLDPTSLFVNLVLSSIGFGLFMYAKKQGHVVYLLVSVGLMITPWLIPGPLPQVGVGALLLGCAYYFRDY